MDDETREWVRSQAQLPPNDLAHRTASEIRPMNLEEYADVLSREVTVDWLPYWPQDPAEFLGCDLALPGDRVRTRYELPHVGSGVPEGTEGTVVTLGRGLRAHARHRELMALAAAEGRAPGTMEYEPLIDGEGPVVLWDGQDEPYWHPGQSDPTEVVSRYVPPSTRPVVSYDLPPGLPPGEYVGTITGDGSGGFTFSLGDEAPKSDDGE